MRFKRFSAMLLALAMCMGVFSTTVFAYSDESATTTTTEKVIIPGISEPPVRTLRATIPENERHIFR